MSTVDVLAIAAHPDDSELICGGTLAKTVMLGRSAGILALTAGELGTRGSPELRDNEAAASARALGLAYRETLGLPDGGVMNSVENRARVAVAIRRTKPKIVITHALQGRHPDHAITAELVRDACFVAGLKNVEPGTPPHRPLKILHALSFREHAEKPTFIVDISDALDTKLEAIECFASQFTGVTQGGEVYPTGEPLLERVRQEAAHYGSMIRVRYGEPFFTTETMRVEDVTLLDVATL